jgi:hypothetical protein
MFENHKEGDQVLLKTSHLNRLATIIRISPKYIVIDNTFKYSKETGKPAGIGMGYIEPIKTEKTDVEQIMEMKSTQPVGSPPNSIAPKEISEVKEESKPKKSRKKEK